VRLGQEIQALSRQARLGCDVATLADGSFAAEKRRTCGAHATVLLDLDNGACVVLDRVVAISER
jgi:hypothetical protein